MLYEEKHKLQEMKGAGQSPKPNNVSNSGSIISTYVHLVSMDFM